MTDARPELDLLGTWVRVLSIRTRLLAWYDREKRGLPWRSGATPYRTLVSEMMAQQTRVEVVIPYFERWCAVWPDFASLAAAPEDDVLAAWSGLGYYRRARFLHETAKRVMRDHGGELPRDAASLRALPGIGPYTAAAIASISWGEAVAVVDGNVERVVCRLLALQDEPGAARDRVVREAARRLVTGLAGEDPSAQTPPEGLRPGEWNQAMMELGSTVCVPSSPRCAVCPLGRSCIGHRAGVAAELPKRRTKRAAVDVELSAALVRRGESYLLLRRPEGSLMSGLWEVPTTREGEDLRALERRASLAVGEDVRIAESAAWSFRHTITHRRITVRVHEASAGSGHTDGSGRADGAGLVSERAAGVAWVTRADLRDFGVSSMTRKAIAGPIRAGG